MGSEALEPKELAVLTRGTTTHQWVETPWEGGGKASDAGAFPHPCCTIYKTGLGGGELQREEGQQGLFLG